MIPGTLIPSTVPGRESGPLLEPKPVPAVPLGEETIDHVAHAGALRGPAALKLRMASLGAVVLPFVALIAGVVLLWGPGPWQLGWPMLTVTLVGYVLTAMGITIGYHRLFTHKSFDATAPVAWFFGILGSMAVQGSVIQWVSTHRMHHQHSDHEGDPHSPHAYGETWRDLFAGFTHAHFRWFFRADPPELYKKYAPDLLANKRIALMDRLFVPFVVLGLLIPAAIGFAISGTWVGAAMGFLWGGLVRVFIVHHVTWSVNSVCHLWGKKDYHSHDESRNNLIVGILAMGEGWHNNHHAFPASARHGLKWWQFDSSYLVIKALQLVGLVKKVRVPDQAILDRKKR